MSDVKFYCPECGARLSVNEDLSGRPVACPDCSAQIPIPPTSKPGAPPVGKVLSLDLRFRCPSCEKKLAVDAVYAGAPLTCPQCDEQIAVPHLQPDLLPAIPSANRTEVAAPPGQPASVLSEDEVAFLLAPE